MYMKKQKYDFENSEAESEFISAVIDFIRDSEGSFISSRSVKIPLRTRRKFGKPKKVIYSDSVS